MNLNPLIGRLAAWAFVAFASTAAHADNPATGSALYAANCTSSGCHGATPLVSNSSKIYNGRNARAVIDAAIAGDTGGMARLSAAFPAGGVELADVAAYLGNTPASVAFTATPIGTTAAAQTVTVNASLKGGNSLSGLSITTTGDFARSGGSCAATVGTGLNCTVLVTFTPTASGTRTGTLNIASDNSLTPVAIALTGTGSGSAAAPVASITPAALTLASTAIGATSAAQNVTVANTGNAALAVSAITLGNPADYTIAGGTCAAGGTVSVGASCTVSVAFHPAAGPAGARTGSLSIAHNAAGSPGTVSLTGIATAAAAPIASSTAALAFGSVNVGTVGAAQTATLSNSGTAALLIGTFTTGSAEFNITGGTCAAGGSVAAAGSCTVTLAFSPAAAGARSASLVITHNATGGQSSTSLAGTGVALNPVIGVSPTTLAFSQTLNSASAAQTVTVSNSGNAALVIAALSLGGAQSAEFQTATGSTCVAGSSVAPNASCVIMLTFAPTAIGARGAALSITHNAAGSPSSVTLNGIGTSAPQAVLSLNASALAFNAQTVGSTSPAQSVTATNSGSAPLVFNALTLTGSVAADFTRSGTCTLAGSLAAGATCSVAFTFTPGAVGARSATLTLGSNASNGSAVISLAGTGAAAATPLVRLAPASLAFGNQSVGVRSAARTVTLTNPGSGPLSVGAITATGMFAVTNDCGANVAAGASCTLSATFTPGTTGAASGGVSVASNAAGSPHAVGLTGTGVLVSPVLAWTQSAAALNFGDMSVGAAAATRTLTLANQGPGTVVLQQFTLAGAQAGDFSLGSAGTCAVGVALAQGASCTLTLAFQPGAVGPRAGALHVASNGTNPPDVALAGNGTAAAQPGITLTPAALSFSATADATTVPAQTFTLQSSGNAVLRVTALRVASGSFTLMAAATSGCSVAPFDLLPGQSCAMAVGWSNTAVGSETGGIDVDTNAAAAPAQVALQAVRAAAGTPPPPPAPPPTTASSPVPDPTQAVATNIGGSGCSIARNPTLTDPTLLLLGAAAAGVLKWRRRNPRPARG